MSSQSPSQMMPLALQPSSSKSLSTSSQETALRPVQVQRSSSQASASSGESHGIPGATASTHAPPHALPPSSVVPSQSSSPPPQTSTSSSPEEQVVALAPLQLHESSLQASESGPSQGVPRFWSAQTPPQPLLPSST